jgi:hypothetical protein
MLLYLSARRWSNMELPDKAALEFQALFKKHFGIDISLDEARLRARNLIYLYRAVYWQKREGNVAEKETFY